MKRRVGLLSTICAFCLLLVCGFATLFNSNENKADAASAAGSYNVTGVTLHGVAGGSDSMYLVLWNGNVPLEHDLAVNQTEDTNVYLKDFASQLIFNGEPFEKSGGGGLITMQDSQQNWKFQKWNGSTATSFSEGDWIMIPRGTVFKTSTLTFTFVNNYKFVYSSTACTNTVDGVNCGTSGSCLHGFHSYAWTGTASTISQVSINNGSGDKGNAYFQFWASSVVDPGYTGGTTATTNGLLKAFESQLTFNGKPFAEGAKVTGQGNINLLFQRKDGADFAEGDTIYIPYGAKLVSSTATLTFGYHYKIVASSKTCEELANCQTTLGGGTSKYCRSQYFHVFRWANGEAEPEAGTPVTQARGDNTAVLISAMTKTDGTVGKVAYYYNSNAYAISFDMLNCYGAGFGVVIGNKTNISATNDSYTYMLFKQDGTPVNSLGYTDTFSYQVGKTYKFAVESSKLNLYEKGVMDANSEYALVASANVSLSSWDSIGFLAVSDQNRSATAVIDNVILYNQSGVATLEHDLNAWTTPMAHGWSATNSNGKGTVEMYNKIMYSVSFLNENGEILSTQRVCANGKATAPTTNPSLEGYEFTGWSDDYSMITSNVAIHPTFKAIGEDDSSDSTDSSQDSSSDSSSDSTDSSQDSSSDSTSDSTDSSQDSVEDSTSDSTDNSQDSVEDSSVEDSSTDVPENSSTDTTVESDSQDSEQSDSVSVGGTSSSTMKIGGCMSSVTGILPILTLLGVGILVKGRKE